MVPRVSLWPSPLQWLRQLPSLANPSYRVFLQRYNIGGKECEHGGHYGLSNTRSGKEKTGTLEYGEALQPSYSQRVAWDPDKCYEEVSLHPPPGEEPGAPHGDHDHMRECGFSVNQREGP